jgi:hypothetical protein
MNQKGIPERPSGVPPPYATEWEYRYDERTAECTLGRLEAALKPQPQVWPASGPLAKTWNPGSTNPVLPQ